MSLLVAAWWLAASAGRGAGLPLSINLGLWATLMINLSATGLLLGAPWWVQEMGLSGQRAKDPFVRLTGYKEVAGVIAEVQSSPIVLASDDRKLLANLAAYLPNARVYAFNPVGLKDNHWQLQYDLKQLMAGQEANKEPKKILLVQVADTRTPPADLMERISRNFDQVEPLDQAHPNLSAALATIRLEGKPNQGAVAHWVWLRALKLPQPSQPTEPRNADRSPYPGAPAQ
jgi:hypothetical protein